MRHPRLKPVPPEKLLEYAREACLLAGFLMLARGLWLVYQPLMWLVCGALLLWIGLPKKGVK